MAEANNQKSELFAARNLQVALDGAEAVLDVAEANFHIRHALAMPRRGDREGLNIGGKTLHVAAQADEAVGEQADVVLNLSKALVHEVELPVYGVKALRVLRAHFTELDKNKIRKLFRQRMIIAKMRLKAKPKGKGVTRP